MNSLYQNKMDKSETFKYDRNRTTCSLQQARIFKSIMTKRGGERTNNETFAGCVSDD